MLIPGRPPVGRLPYRSPGARDKRAPSPWRRSSCTPSTPTSASATAAPIFLNADGDARLSYSTSYALIRRLARRAGIVAADKISPHSLRHSFATELLAAGVPLQDVQDAMGHADPRTTRAYDRSRHNLDRHPT